MSKLPAMQFYPGDWRKDPGIQALSYEERGIWLELLLLMHESQRRGYLLLNDQPMSDEIVGKILGIHGNKWKKIKRKLQVTGVVSIEENTKTLYNRRMARDEELRQKRITNGHLGAEHGQKGAEFGKLGGRPKTPQETPQETPQKPPPSSSSSSSSSFSFSNTEEKKKEESSCQVSNDTRRAVHKNGIVRNGNGHRKHEVANEAMKLAEQLRDSILANYPNARSPTKADLHEWATELDRLHRLDGKTWEEITWLLAWSQKDPFWKMNIQSGGKFRQQWNQLLAKASRETGIGEKMRPEDFEERDDGF